jgi:hypothetical protein
MNKFKIPEESLKSLIIYPGVILFVILLVIIPLYKSNSDTNKDIKKLKSQIEEQKSFANVFSVLNRSMKNKDSKTLPNPPQTTIPRQDAEKFQDTFRAIAIKSGLMTVSLTPDLSTLTSTSPYLLFNAVTKGEFANFRNMLVGLGGISYLNKIEEIQIQQYSDSMEFRIKIWIALAS